MLIFFLSTAYYSVFYCTFNLFIYYVCRQQYYCTFLYKSDQQRCYFCAVLAGSLNDRLLLANPTEINPRQKKGVEIRSCLVGLLEPLLIGFATMQQRFEPKLDLSEILYQITSRFSSSHLQIFLFCRICWFWTLNEIL